MHILIYEKKKKRQVILRTAIEKSISANYQLIITSDKIKFLYLSGGANIIYAYSLSRYAVISNLKLLYLGQVGDRSRNTSANYLICSPKNYAFKFIAEYVLASVLAYERKLSQNAFLHNNINWKQDNYLNPLPKHFHQLKIGVLGLGTVGREISNLFKKMGCELLVHDNDPTRIHPSDTVLWPEMLGVVDYMILAVSDRGNENLINTSLIEKMNPGLCIVNISRASVIDEKALIEALGTKKIRGAIFDVFSIEPLPRRNPYRKLKNVVITPHIAGNIDLVFPKIADHFVGEVKKIANV